MTHHLQSQLSAIAHDYDVLLCDVWGVIHNGVAVYDGVLEAFAAFKAQGGYIILITNAPRPFSPVIQALNVLGVPRQAYDDIVTSGDATIELIKRQSGDKVHHIGSQKDLPLFDGLEIGFTSLEQADMIVCTDLDSEYGQALDQYNQLLAPGVAKNLPMICANPDLIIDFGGQKTYCAGVVAQIYKQLGGRVLMVGKPFDPIYDIAFDKLARAMGREPDRKRVLAIGDAVKTDLAGAYNQGLDIFFIKGGIHAFEAGAPSQQGQFEEAMAPYKSAIKAMAPRLVW